jgi:uncharacterized repeat protein (TIGR01451 family)
MKRLALLFLMIVITLLPTAATAEPSNRPAWQAKVDSRVLAQAEAGPAEFILMLDEQADLSGAEQIEGKAAKGQYVYEQLTAVAGRTQGPALAQLEALAKSNPGGVEYRPYWVSNMIWVRGDASVLQALSSRPEIERVHANPWVEMDLPGPAQPDVMQAAAPESVAWNIDLVGAPQVWAVGYRGQGAVIGGQDTGYDWDHPALKRQYRGWNGAAANHNYNWHDAIHSGVTSCGVNSPEPCDDSGHGTHTMGTMVGDDGGANKIGMAPAARWIGCRNMSEGYGTPATYAECYQWFIAPTDLNGQNPRPDLAPDVINNSWSCPVSEGCTDPLILLNVVNAVRAAGIMTVHSAGNDGLICSSIDTPAAIYDASFTIGATTSRDVIWSRSSRGPVTVDGSGRIKPDVSAPGEGVFSSYPGSGYTILSGTSMAAPHVAGLAALLISANPALSGNVDRIEQAITSSALRKTGNQFCGTSGNRIPNNIYGYGRIQAYNAFRYVQPHILALSKAPAAPYYFPGEEVTYTLHVLHTHLSAPTTGIVLRDTIPSGVDFVSATGPYTRIGNEIEWRFASMAAGARESVNLTVRVPQTASGPITNANYTVSSADVGVVTGLPVTILPYENTLFKFFPLYLKRAGS